MRFTLWRKQAFGLKKRRVGRRLFEQHTCYFTLRQEFLALISAKTVQHRTDKRKETKKILCAVNEQR
jgi:hypothetical protein